jgi:H+/Cl- antiporter ClcA
MGGGALGREGPLVQISSSIFVLIAQKTKNILPRFDLRTWVIAGSAAGLAAAFNTPLAGIIFAIEELSQFHFDRQFYEFKNKAFFAVIIAGVTAQLMTGSYVLFEFPPMHFIWQVEIAFVLLLIATVCGLSAWLLRKYIGVAELWRNKVTGFSWYLFPIIGGLIVAIVSYYVGINSFGAGMYTIQSTLKSSAAVIGLEDSIGRFINVLASAASGCAGGILLPALALGAGIGSMGSISLPMTDARIFVATGMAAFLGAMLNAPLTAAVLVLEITNQRELILPLFLSTLAASWMCSHCGGSGRMKVRIANILG